MADGLDVSGVGGSFTTETPASTLGDVLVGALVYGAKTIGNTFFTKGIVLGVLFFFVDFIITFFLELLGGFLKMSDLSEMFDKLPNKDMIGYAFYLLAVDYGLPMMLAAYLLKFFIRRIPFVG